MIKVYAFSTPKAPCGNRAQLNGRRELSGFVGRWGG
jgi:hypothetical protein